MESVGELSCRFEINIWEINCGTHNDTSLQLVFVNDCPESSSALHQMSVVLKLPDHWKLSPALVFQMTQ